MLQTDPDNAAGAPTSQFEDFRISTARLSNMLNERCGTSLGPVTIFIGA
ncbi:MAG: hypothetical protein ACE5GC_04420 [Acidimicrobiia bacterium]